jgi:hypothetical protein
MAEGTTPEQEARRLYEEAESRTAKAVEEVVGRESFGEVLARVTDNVVALTRVGNDTWDLLLRNMRLAGRADVNRLARQLARTEDKLELVLQEVEALREDLAAARAAADGTGKAGAKASGANSRGRASSGTGRAASRRSGGNRPS